MNQLVTSSMVQVLHGDVKTTSLQVAEFFGKNHKDVLKAIKNLECSEGFRQRNFAPTTNSVALPGFSGERQDPAYEITRDGFAFLGMGFTGKEAAAFKEAYIEAFNSMERALQARVVTDALEGNVAARTKLGVSVRRGLSQRQWDDLYEIIREMAADDREYNAIHSHFARYFGASEPISYSLALGYLDRVRAAFACGYAPEYRNGRLVIEEAML